MRVNNNYAQSFCAKPVTSPDRQGKRSNVAKDPRDKVVDEYAKRWANLLEKEIKGYIPESAIERTSLKAQGPLDGLTCKERIRAASYLSKNWEHGALLEDWQKAESQRLKYMQSEPVRY